MSLIRDQIRQSDAQKRGSGEKPSDRSPWHRPLFCLLLLCVAGGGLLLAGGTLVYIALSPEEEEAVPADAGMAATAPVAPPPVEPVQEEETAEPEAGTLVSEDLPASEMELPPSEKEAGEAPVAAVPEAVQPSPEIERLMKTMRISGIRISDAGARATINGKMFSVGEKLPAPFDLELIRIEPDQLVFRDGSGLTYRRHF